MPQCLGMAGSHPCARALNRGPRPVPASATQQRPVADTNAHSAPSAPPTGLSSRRVGATSLPCRGTGIFLVPPVQASAGSRNEDIALGLKRRLTSAWRTEESLWEGLQLAAARPGEGKAGGGGGEEKAGDQGPREDYRASAPTSVQQTRELGQGRHQEAMGSKGSCSPRQAL